MGAENLPFSLTKCSFIVFWELIVLKRTSPSLFFKQLNVGTLQLGQIKLFFWGETVFRYFSITCDSRTVITLCSKRYFNIWTVIGAASGKVEARCCVHRRQVS